MNKLTKINKIKRLAKKFGTPLPVVDFGIVENGVVFFYSVGNESYKYSYNNAERGIDEELERLKRLLSVEV